MSKKEQLEKLIAYYSKGNKTAFGVKLGLTPQGISNWLTRDTFDAALIFTKCENVSAEWLLTGKGDMLISQTARPKVQAQFSLRSDRHIDMQAVPLYELDATAGLVALFDEHTRQAPINHLHIPDLPPCDGALYVRGDSMYPLLKSGDIVLYKEVHDHSNILYGEMYLLSFTIAGDDYITIKYIQRADQPGMVRLVSHNPHHQPKDIPIDSIRALALIKASVRYCTMG